MKRILIALFLFIFIISCTPIPKYELPVVGDPVNVIYKKDTVAQAPKNQNYEAVMNRFRQLSEDAKIVQEDKANCYFQMTGYAPYVYKGKEHKFSYLLSFQGEKDSTHLMINRIKILHYNIEHMYRDDKRRTTKHFNPVYQQIDMKVRGVLKELTNELK